MQRQHGETSAWLKAWLARTVQRPMGRWLASLSAIVCGCAQFGFEMLPLDGNSRPPSSSDRRAYPDDAGNRDSSAGRSDASSPTDAGGSVPTRSRDGGSPANADEGVTLVDTGGDAGSASNAHGGSLGDAGDGGPARDAGKGKFASNTGDAGTTPDECPLDPDKTLPGVCGCGIPDSDSDSDGTPDCNDGCPSNPETAVPPCAVASDQVALGYHHSCHLQGATGSFQCWGDNPRGQLGYGNTTPIGNTPGSLGHSGGDVQIGGFVTQLVGGATHTCALLSGGNVRCWGDGSNGALGYGNLIDWGDDELPSAAGDVNVGGTVVQLTAGQNHTCALLNTGNVRCWGQGSLGRLGYANQNTIGDDESPADAGDVDVGGDVVQISAGLGGVPTFFWIISIT